MNVTYPEPPMHIDVYRYIARLEDDPVIRDASTYITIEPESKNKILIEEAGNEGYDIDDSQVPPKMVGDGSEVVKRAQDIATEMFGHSYSAGVYEDDTCSETMIRIWPDWWQRNAGRTGPLSRFTVGQESEA